jgi:hypothetical protein
MIRDGKRVLAVMALVWAIICGGFAFEMIQQEARRLNRGGVGGSGAAKVSQVPGDPAKARPQAPTNGETGARGDTVRELFWIVGPFFWLSLTLGGYIVAAGLFLPTRWIVRRSRKRPHPD